MVDDETDSIERFKEKGVLTLSDIDRKQALLLLLDVESNLCIGCIMQREALLHGLINPTVA